MLEPLPTLLSQLEQMRSRGVPFVLVTLIGVQGSSTRKLGARMWVGQDGFTLGTVSFGSCGDGEIKKQVQDVLEAGRARRFSFVVGEDENTELGLACTGDLEVFLEPNPPLEAVWKDALEHLNMRRAVTLETTLEDLPRHEVFPVGARHTSPPPMERFALEPLVNTFHEVWTPPPHLVIVGANPISGPLSRMARELGCVVTVFDARPEKVTLAAFPQAHRRLSGDLEQVLQLERSDARTAVVVISHNYADEVFALRAALSSEAGYIAVLASGRRGRALLRFLEDLDFSKPQLERVRTPAGLDLGLESPAGIALSILSEMTAVLHGRTAVPFVQKQKVER